MDFNDTLNKSRLVAVDITDNCKTQMKSGLTTAKKLFNPQKMKGIGEYEESLATSKTGRRALCIAKIIFDVFLIIAATYGVYITAVFVPVAMIFTVPTHLYLSWRSANSMWGARIENRGLVNLAPSTHNLIPKEVHNKCKKLEKWDTTPMNCYAFSDSKETFEFKKKMITGAEQEILLSGSYCGRKAFDEILDLIEIQMKKKPNLKVYILTATRFMTNQDKFKSKNWTKVQQLTEKYPERFFTALTFETEQANPISGYKYISNHTKLMIVDRKAMVTGGSGIEDRWAYTDGLEAYDQYHDTGIVNSAIAKTFRDKDFLLTVDEDNSVVERSALEFFKLMTRWNHFDMTVKVGHPQLQKIQAKRKGYPIKTFHNFYAPLNTEQPRLNLHKCKEDLPVNRPECVVNGVKVFMSGPEQQENKLEETLIRLINGAQRKIIINHMYFHPTPQVLEALREALKHGVNVKILTNAKSDLSPNSHTAFGPRSVFHARDLARTKGISGTIELYYWNVKASTNHQKVIMVDEKYTLCGSSNLGYKGFESMSDYEHNLLIDSEEICEQLEKDFEYDLKYSKQYDPKELKRRPTIKEYCSAMMHMHLQAKIG